MQTDLMLPVFIQIGLTFWLLFYMGAARVKAVKNNETTFANLADDATAYPKPVVRIANAFHNQLQLPVLFYALVAFVLLFQQSDIVFVVLAWVFVASRLWHAWIHTTHNHIPTRFKVFVVGVTILITMWVYLAIKLYII